MSKQPGTASWHCTTAVSTTSPLRLLPKLSLFVVLLALPWLATTANAADSYVPVKWTKFVTIESPSEPVADMEARRYA